MIFYIEKKDDKYTVNGSSYAGHFYITTCSTEEEAKEIIEKLNKDRDKWE